MSKITFLGFGNIAQAMVHGLQRHGHNKYEFAAASPSLKHDSQGVITYTNNKQAVQDANIIILAVKPTKVVEVLTEVKQDLPVHSILLSVAAGVTLTKLAKLTSSEQVIVRAMPNIAIAVGEGATVLCANHNLAGTQRAAIEQIFCDLGILTWVSDDGDLDLFTAFSGSGPAYIFFFLEALMAAAISIGVEAQLAQRFTVQIMKGALQLAIESGKPLAALRKQVSSPRGTTVAAINVLAQHGFNELMQQAIKEAYNHAIKLGDLK